MSNKDKVSYIALYIKCDGFAYPYRVFYKYNNQNIVYNSTFKDTVSANLFLKELYENVNPGFLHYNYTMQEYDAKSKDTYFFNIKNDAIKKAYEYDGLAKPVYNLRPLKRTCKKLFGKGLKSTKVKNDGQLKEFFTCAGIISAVLIPSFAFVSYEYVKSQKILKDIDEKEKHIKEMENKIQDLEYKTINMMDTIKQNNR